MKAIILAGGRGTRLYPVTLETPKPLLTVRKKPILNYLVELFLSQGIYDIGISINAEHKDDYEWWYKRWWRDHPLRFFEEADPLGTFGALVGAAHFVRNEEFFVTNGDELKQVDLKAMQEFHRKHQSPATIALVEHEHPHDYGVAILDGPKITKFLEKPKDPPTNLISSGLYLFTPAIFEHYDFGDPRFEMLEHDLFPVLASQGRLFGYPYRGQWHDCGTFERWQKAIEEWRG